MTSQRPHIHLHRDDGPAQLQAHTHNHAHGHTHRHAHGHAHGHAAVLPLSLIAQSAYIRIGAILFLVAVLWLAVFWAVSLP